MNAPEAAETLLIPVSVSPGAFPGECFVTMDTLDGPVSGFIRADDVKSRGEQKYLIGRVVERSMDRISIILQGSFFTTTGLAHFSKDAVRSAA